MICTFTSAAVMEEPNKKAEDPDSLDFARRGRPGYQPGVVYRILN
jgi:hypothetical protein